LRHTKALFVIAVSMALGISLTYATTLLYSTTTAFYSGGHPAGLYISYGYPLPVYNDTYHDGFVGSFGTQFYYLNILTDLLLFFAVSGALIVVLFELRSKLLAKGSTLVPK